MSQRIVIQLGKKDEILKEWCLMVGESSENFTKLVKDAIKFYCITNSFLQLGNVPSCRRDNNKLERFQKVIVFSRDEEIKYLEELKNRLGTSSGKAIKQLLSFGITSNKKEEAFIVKNDELTKLLLKVATGEEPNLVTIHVGTSRKVETEEENYTTTKTSETESSQNETIDNPTKNEETVSEGEEEGDPFDAFFDSLINPGNGLGQK